MKNAPKPKIKKKIASWAVFALAAVVLAGILPMAVQAADNNPAWLRVRQIYTAPAYAGSGTFSYRMRPLDQANPMPPGSAEAGYAFEIAGNGSAQIGPIEFLRQGTYRYEISQLPTGRLGYVYDDKKYTVEAYVDESLNVTIIVKNENGNKSGELVFECGYAPRPTDPALMVDPPVMKTISGNPSQNSVFEFRLVARNASQPMPPGSANGAKTIAIAGSGRGEFGTWGYDAPGVYYYTVYEINSGASGYTYDTAVYTITDTVTDNSGALAISRIVTNDLNKPVTSLIFNNRYSSGGWIEPPPATTTPTQATTTSVPPITAWPTGTTESPPTEKVPTTSITITDPTEPTKASDATGPIEPSSEPEITNPTDLHTTKEPPAPTDMPGKIDPTDPTKPTEPTEPTKSTEPAGPAPTDPPGDQTPSKPYIDGPKTGDDSNIAGYTMLFVFGALLSIVGAIYLIAGKKNNKNEKSKKNNENKNRNRKERAYV
ncbi:MAG: hypothetical protein FWH48_01725 [Oscillospiraceae bacterium]|nr:hypothetical protein [Oscillospiraceae bacterium]